VDSDASLICWLKFRLWVEPDLSEQPPDRDDEFEGLSTLLHMGFVFVEETAEMIERLKVEDLTTVPGELERRSETVDVARSQVFSTHLIPRPIDRVAGRVAPFKA
jgi:hypothetical protein